jgi:glycosyltransferase involved in cell wall biosynthesis
MEKAMDKIKIAWITHFSNQEIRNKIPLSKMFIYNSLRKIVKKPKYKYYDFAPWVTNLIKEFKNFDDVEIHIIAPHKGLKPLIFDFVLDGIHYHFFRPYLSLILSQLSNRLLKNKQRKFIINRLIVKNYIKKINPDLVNLIGNENPYYSITALDIHNKPVYISAQTVYTNPMRKIYSDSCIKLNWDIELKLHKKFKYFGCTSRMHHDLIRQNNPNAIIFKMFFPIEHPPIVQEVPKEYDFVFFAAGVTKKKGIEDAIDALALVKKEKPNVKLNVSGKCESTYLAFLKQKIAELNLTNNVIFTDYFPVHTDIYQNLKKSKFALLPVKLDAIPSTVIESILLGIPVITYKTTGMPYLNREKECVLLTEIGNIEGLANNMLKLMNDEIYANKLAQNAKEFVTRTFDNTTSAKRLLEDYKAVIAHYHNGIPIPKELLFDLNEFPNY